MAHYKRKHPRSSSSGYYSANGLKNRLDDIGLDPRSRKKWHQGYPRWWDKVFHTRPARTKNRVLEKKILKDADSENMCWPDNRKPHIYYW